MLIVVLLALVALVTVLGVRSGRVTVRSCCSGPWPPDDLTGVEDRARGAGGETGRATPLPALRGWEAAE